jgi:hypothetical protein
MCNTIKLDSGFNISMAHSVKPDRASLRAVLHDSVTNIKYIHDIVKT